VTFNIKDRALTATLERHAKKAQKQNADSLEKLSSGTVFTKNDPRPSDRALSEGLEFKLRGLTSSKRNINDAVSLLQTAEGTLSEVSNMVIRMKEINIAAASTTLDDKERRFLFVEYEALFDEINRIAVTTEFNGIPLLNGQSEDAPEALIFRVGDPTNLGDDGGDEDDINVIRFEGLQEITATAEGLGINSARDILVDSDELEGLALEDVVELMEPEDDEFFATTFDQALNTISTARSIFGGMQSRMQRALDYIDVYQENLTAAKSNITDVDFAKESAKLAESNLLLQASTAMLTHGNITGKLALSLVNGVI
jgi:flagellin